METLPKFKAAGLAVNAAEVVELAAEAVEVPLALVMPVHPD
jgi:hypothetical protein